MSATDPAPNPVTGRAGRRVLIVQHGDKVRAPGDPGLSDLGHEQAATTATWLRDHLVVAPVVLRASPLRRAVETAAPIAAAFELAADLDERFRERMNWDGSIPFEDFLDDWAQATADRGFRPRTGDSSREAATRFLAGLDDLVASIGDGSVAIVVAHGGVTTDALRTILGDDALAAVAPTLVAEGVPSAAVTALSRNAGGWAVDAPPSVAHLGHDR